jgi:antirestriction protein ArdC
MNETTTKEEGMTRTASKTTKPDVYQRVTDRIIESLESGVVPWRQPWKTIGGAPRNLNSGRVYRGVNVMLTTMDAMLKGYSDNRWATFNGIKRAGGSVRKGEHGTLVILWKPIEKKDKTTGDVIDKFLMLKGYTVFNVEQADFPNGIPGDGNEDELRSHDENEVAEEIITDYTTRENLKLTRGGNSAHYVPFRDTIAVPTPEQFKTGEAFYTTTFHEIVHSTGHESRLNRTMSTNFGSDEYAAEELVAELGAAMLNGIIGIEETIEDSAAYIANWLRVLRDDKKFVVQAAAKAQRAVDLVLGTKFDNEEAAPVASSEEAA